MLSTVNFLILSTLVLIKLCTCRYIVPQRPPLELLNQKDHRPEEEFLGHALRVGNIIADLLRSEIRLLLKLNTTIDIEKKNQHQSDGKNKSLAVQQRDQIPEEHVRSEKIHSKETQSVKETSLESHHLDDSNLAENQHQHPMKDHKEMQLHDKDISKNIDKNKTSVNKNNCVCLGATESKTQPATLMLEQKIYGASLSRDIKDYNSPVIVQKFIWNPHNESWKPPPDPQQSLEHSPTKVLNHPVTLKPSPPTSAAKSTPPLDDLPGTTVNKPKENIGSHSPQNVSESQASSKPASKPPKQTSFNPLADLADTNEENKEGENPLNVQEQQGMLQNAATSLTENPPEAESQGEPPGIELVEKSITEKPVEQVKEDVIDVQNNFN